MGKLNSDGAKRQGGSRKQPQNEPCARMLAQVVEALGGQTELARQINRHLDNGAPRIQQQTIYYWLQTGEINPIYVRAMEVVSGIPRYKWNEQVYPEHEYKGTSKNPL